MSKEYQTKESSNKGRFILAEMIEEFMERVIFKLHVEMLTGTFKEENKESCGGE